MDKGPWYNKNIFTKLISQSFEYYLKKGRKDRYELMCAADVYAKYHVTILDNSSSSGGIPMPSASSKGELFSLGQTFNFIDNWIQCFEANYKNRINVY